MKTDIQHKHVTQAIHALLPSDAKRATVYVAPDAVVKATRQHKPSARATRHTILVTFGRPNYAERQFIKQCQKAGEPFPVKKAQLKFYPKKKCAAR